MKLLLPSVSVKYRGKPVFPVLLRHFHVPRVFMRQSHLFTKTRREAPADEVSKNAKLLIRGGFVHKEMAGVYSFLPLGLRVYRKIENIIREEMNAIGGQEILLTALQDPVLWQKSGRWNDAVVDNWFKSKLVSGGEIGIANTHEEPITEILTHFVNSHKDLPLSLYQFQTKFRNELRAKGGIMRVREFIMKDLYSFSRSEEEFKRFYEECAKAYLKIFKRVNLEHITYRTLAAGGSFTTGFTDEFQTLCSTGEDSIYVDKTKKIAINKEVYSDENIARLGLNKNDLVEEKSVEVGNIFPLGTKYSKVMGLFFRDEEGNEKPAIMGSYGIGLGRLMGTLVEVLSDERGMVWPESVAPYRVHLIGLPAKDDAVKEKVEKTADKCFEALLAKGIEVLYDDRAERTAGEKFADSDLIGIPWRAVISEKTVLQEKIEVKKRTGEKPELMTFSDFLKNI